MIDMVEARVIGADSRESAREENRDRTSFNKHKRVRWPVRRDTMLFGNMVGRDFNNLPSRIIYNLAVQVSPFRPVDECGLAKASQQDLYEFVCGFYEKIMEDPTRIGMDISPDECENRPLEDKTYLDTRKLMRKQEKKITDLFAWLVMCGQDGDVIEGRLVADRKATKMTKPKLAVLDAVGISGMIQDKNVVLWNEEYPRMMSAVRYVASISPEKRPSAYLMRGIFDPGYDYSRGFYRDLCNDPRSLNRVTDYVESNGFQISFCTADEYADIRYRAGKRYGDSEIMLLCEYDKRYHNQLMFTFVSDKKVFDMVLGNFAGLDGKVQDMFFSIIKECQECGFCNQTNRNRPLACIEIEYNGAKTNKCTYFQHLRRRDLNGDFVDSVLHFYEQFASGAYDDFL